MFKAGFELFIDVANKASMTAKTRERFLLYMLARWPQESDPGYVQTWADRFMDGCEYGASDNKGLEVLGIIDRV